MRVMTRTTSKFALLLSLALSSLGTIFAADTTLSTGNPSGVPTAANQEQVPPTVSTVRGFFREIALGHPGAGPAIVAVDPDDTIWIALARTGQLARLMNGNLDLFDLGSDSRPVGIAVGTAANGHPGEIWIAAAYDNKIIRWDVATRGRRDYKIEGDDAWPFNIAIGPEGAIWFSQRASGRIGRLFPESGRVEHYDVPTPNAGPAGLAVDPKSGAVWFSESYADRVGRLDPKTGKIEEFVMGEASTGQTSGPAGLAIDASGGVWFAKLEGKLGHIAPKSKTIELLDVPPEAMRTAGVAIGHDQNVWALALDGNLLLRYDPQARTFTQYPLPNGSADSKPLTPPFARTARPFGIGIDRQGNVWFSEQYVGQLGVLDVAAPTAEIVNPRGKVELGLVPLTTRVFDRIAGVAETKVTIDGEAARFRNGRLDLTLLAPGAHRLEVAVRDAAGHETRTGMDLDYAPNHLALKELLSSLEPKGERGLELRTQWLDAAGKLPKGSRDEIVAELRAGLAAEAAQFQKIPSRTLAAFARTLDFQRARAGKSVDVAILDAAPYFSPQPLVVQAGDSVVWRYDPPSDGHSISKKLHRVVIEANTKEAKQGQGTAPVQSGLLRAGESFTYRFEAAGKFTIRDSEASEAAAASLAIEVVAPPAQAEKPAPTGSNETSAKAGSR